MIKRFLTGMILGILFSTLVARADADAGESPGFALQLDPKGITASESAPLQAFLNGIVQILPDAMKDGIGRPIRVRFSKMSDLKQLVVPACEGAPETLAAGEPSSESFGDEQTENSSDKQEMEILGHDNLGGHASSVDMNSLFKQEILIGPSASRIYACGHHSMYALAQATLIHELAHVYDARLGKLRSTRNRYFQKLMGFTKQWSWSAFLFRALQTKNRLMFRSPDPYEFKTIKESFAVNMEYFLLDPEYGCRRPTVAAYYRKLLGITTPPSCQINTTVYANSDNPQYNLNQPLNLDPKRIYDIHYFLASKGDQFESKWGHAMFRLIICAPDRKTVGPECLKDVQYHMILSYRANVQDLVLSTTKGLDGKYPSQLYILPLTDVLTEYNKLELRDIVSLPLNLTEQQKKQFIYRTLEQYWEYQGRYYFITNNCATEALNFLQGVVPNREIQRLSDFTPLGLEGDLNKTGLIDESLLTNRDSAVEQGYFFASKRPVLDTAFSQIAAQLNAQGYSGFDLKSSDEYMAKTTAAQRMDYFNAAMKNVSGEQHLKMAAYFYLLESYISSFDQQQLSDKVTAKIQQMADQKNADASADSADAQITPAFIASIQDTRPWARLMSGYGIPLPADFSPKEATQENDQRQTDITELSKWIQSEFQSDIQVYQQIGINEVTFRQAIAAGPQ